MSTIDFKQNTVNLSRILSLITIFFSMGVSAKPAVSSKETVLFLSRLETQIYLSLNEYYSFGTTLWHESSVEGILETNRKIHEQIHLYEISEYNNGVSGRDQFQLLMNQWREYKNAMDKGLLKLQYHNYLERRLLLDITAKAYALNQTAKHLQDLIVDTKLLDRNNTDVLFTQFKIGRLTSDLSRMLAEYTSRAASQFNQSYLAEEIESRNPIDIQAKKFDDGINTLEITLNKMLPLNRSIKKSINKWRFISKPYFEYNENHVLLVINKYSKDVINELQDVSSHLSSGSVSAFH